MNLVLDEFVGATKELGCDNDDGRGSVANLLVLLLCEIDEDLSGRMLHGQKGENGSTIVGDCHFLLSSEHYGHGTERCTYADVVNEHLIEPEGTQRALYYVSDGECCCD